MSLPGRAAAASNKLHRANAPYWRSLREALTRSCRGCWIQGCVLSPWERIPTHETPQSSGDQRSVRLFSRLIGLHIFISGNTGGAVCHQAVAPGFLYGGDGGTRTLDLTDVNRAL